VEEVKASFLLSPPLKIYLLEGTGKICTVNELVIVGGTVKLVDTVAKTK
jgi:hypothetical protein